MTREIKFKCWDKEKKIMFKIDNEQSLAGHDFFYNKRFIPLQFTGMLDKEGKDVYEGDIIHHGALAYSPFEWSKSEVYWFEDNHAYYFKKKHNPTSPKDIHVWDSEQLGNISGGCDDKFEIIGNIYENKELLND